jgi:cysteine synthase A
VRSGRRSKPGSRACRGARRTRRLHLDQFGLAERATDWRGNNNIAESIIGQLAHEPSPVPTWIVCGAGTGGTSATLGRYFRYRGLATRLCVAEPTGSGFVEGWRTRDPAALASQPTLIEGIGRPRVEAGFLFDIVDQVVEVRGRAVHRRAWWLEELLGVATAARRAPICRLPAAGRSDARTGERGSIVSLLCDRGERYEQTLFDPAGCTRVISIRRPCATSAAMRRHRLT